MPNERSVKKKENKINEKYILKSNSPKDKTMKHI